MIVMNDSHKDDYDDDDTVWLMDMRRGSIDRWYWQVGSSGGSVPIYFGHMWGRLRVVHARYDTVACIGTQLQQIDRCIDR